MKKNNTTLKILGLGLISGMRATFAPAFAAHYLNKEKSAVLASSKLRFLQTPSASVITKLLSAGEIIGDKLPDAPNRIVAPQVMARVAAGALAGAVICTANKDNVIKGVLLGGVTALAATFGTYHLRKYISGNTAVKEPATGAIEDAIAIGTGVLLMK